MKIILLSLSGVLLTGCATLPFAAMTPDQITAVGKIHDAGFTCVHGVYGVGNITTMSVSADKAVPSNMEASGDCTIKFITNKAVDVQLQDVQRAAHAAGREQGLAIGKAEAETQAQKITDAIKAALEDQAKKK